MTSLPLSIKCYERVFFVRPLEEDPFGYFLSNEAAREFMLANYFGNVRSDDASA